MVLQYGGGFPSRVKIKMPGEELALGVLSLALDFLGSDVFFGGAVLVGCWEDGVCSDFCFLSGQTELP